MAAGVRGADGLFRCCTHVMHAAFCVQTHMVEPGAPLKGLFKAKDVEDAKLSSARQRTYFLVRIIAFLESVLGAKVGVAPAQVGIVCVCVCVRVGGCAGAWVRVRPCVRD
jgi:hypothetical protein